MKEIIELLEGSKQIILTGPPGTGKTCLATEVAEKMIKNARTAEADKEKLTEEEKIKIADKIKDITVDIKMEHGADGRLYGSVTAKDIAEELKKIIGTDVDKRKIVVKDTIKAYGNYTVEIKLLADISAKFIVSVHN